MGRPIWGHSEKVAAASPGGRPQEHPNLHTHWSGASGSQTVRKQNLLFKRPRRQYFVTAALADSCTCLQLLHLFLMIPQNSTLKVPCGWKLKRSEWSRVSGRQSTVNSGTLSKGGKGEHLVACSGTEPTCPAHQHQAPEHCSLKCIHPNHLFPRRRVRRGCTGEDRGWRMRQVRGACHHRATHKEPEEAGKVKTQPWFPLTALRTRPENTQRAINSQWGPGICIWNKCSK